MVEYYLFIYLFSPFFPHTWVTMSSWESFNFITTIRSTTNKQNKQTKAWSQKVKEPNPLIIVIGELE
jgi:hypothetical protein